MKIDQLVEQIILSKMTLMRAKLGQRFHRYKGLKISWFC